MKKIIFFILSMVLFFSCKKSNTIDDPSDSDYNTKEVNVSITLPEGSTYAPEDLKVSTLFTTDNTITDGGSDVEIFDNNAIEIVYATNSSGNIVLMNLVNPMKTETVELNAKTTAQSLAMLHPWVMYLSVQAREEAYEEIALMPEFTSYENKIIEGINSGNLDPLASDAILSAIDEFQISLLERVEINQSPLNMVADDGQVTVTNTNNCLAYSLQLYDEDNNEVGKSYLMSGVNKEIFSFSAVKSYLSGSVDIFEPETFSFPIPNENRKYYLKADRWSGKALAKNGIEGLSSLVGIVSSTLGVVLKNADCGISIGNFFYNNAKTIIDQATQNSITGSEALAQLISFIKSKSSDLSDIAGECSKKASIGFKNITKSISYVGNAENAAQLYFFINDMSKYEAELDFCFEKTESDIIHCNALSLSGTWNTTYIDNTCTYASSTFYNNRALIFEPTDSISGTVNIDAFLNTTQNETYVLNTYNYNTTTKTLVIKINTTLHTTGGDDGIRNFYFEGTYNEEESAFIGNFTYLQEYDGFATSLKKDCSGTMKVSK